MSQNPRRHHTTDEVYVDTNKRRLYRSKMN